MALVVQNVVSTANLRCELDLRRLARSRNAEYNPRKFAAVIMRLRDPRATALIFASGKMVVTGARSEEESHAAATKFARLVMRHESTAVFTDFHIQNIVASTDLGYPLRLDALAAAHASQSNYEPELFPGLIYRLAEPKLVFLLFVSGKVVITGAKTRADIHTAFDAFAPTLALYRKT